MLRRGAGDVQPSKAEETEGFCPRLHGGWEPFRAPQQPCEGV